MKPADPFSQNFSPRFSDGERERYARHFSLPGVGLEGQAALKASRVLIIGAGGLGCPAALYLAAAGVGHLTLLDFDAVQLSNLQRQILFDTSDEGSTKVSVAQERLTAMNPEIEIVGRQVKLTQENAQDLIRDFDVVVDGSDNFQTRYNVNSACVLENKPLVFGAVSRFDAQISVFNYHEGPCYRCLFPHAPGAEAVSNCSEAGVLGVLPGTAGTLMATEVLKILIGIGRPLSGQILTYDALNAEFSKRAFKRRADCETCGLKAERHFATPPPLQEVSWEEFEKRAKAGTAPLVIVDVRSPEEFRQISFPGSRNVPLPLLSARLHQKGIEFLRNEILENARTFENSVVQNNADQNTASDVPLYFVCRSGVRSARALELLSQAGAKNIWTIRGGLDGRHASHDISARP